jgi:hypothetical protein
MKKYRVSNSLSQSDYSQPQRKQPQYKPQYAELSSNALRWVGMIACPFQKTEPSNRFDFKISYRSWHEIKLCSGSFIHINIWSEIIRISHHLEYLAFHIR